MEQYRADLTRSHQTWRGGATSKLHTLDADLKKALQESRRLLVSAGGTATQAPLRRIQQNISVIQKETQLVSSSYEEKVLQLQKEIALEDKRSMQEKQSHDDEMRKYKQQCENDAKERRAIKTILDVKISSLIENVRRLCHKNNLAGPQVTHDLSTLSKLVKASVEALD